MRNLPTAFAATLALCLAAYTPLAASGPTKVDCFKDLRAARELIEDNWSFALFMSLDIDLKEISRGFEPAARRADTPVACREVLGRFLSALNDSHAEVLTFPGLELTAPALVIRSQRERVSRVAGETPAVHSYVYARDTTDAALASIPLGSEIASVNGRPLGELHERVGRRMSGSTGQWRDYRTDRHLFEGRPGSQIELSYRTPSGATRTATVLRPSGSLDALPEELKALLGRAEITSSTRLDDDWGYVRFTSFSLGDPETTIAQLDETLSAVFEAPGLILDLRGNDAGHVDVAAAMAGRFIGERATLGYFNSRAPGQDEVLSVSDEVTGAVTSKPRLLASPRGETYTGPVVILIDRGCLSACETFVGGLQGLGRALVVASESSGGGSGQAAAFELPSGATLAFSTSVAWLPDGQPIEGNGVAPNIFVRERSRDWAVSRDRVLDRAIKALEQGEAKSINDLETGN
jgi:C-terminal processing protease CtpA/Prc